MRNDIKILAAALIFVFGAGLVTESLEYFLTRTTSSYSDGISNFNSLPAVSPRNLETEINIPRPPHAPERQPQGEFFNLQQVAFFGTTPEIIG